MRKRAFHTFVSVSVVVAVLLCAAFAFFLYHAPVFQNGASYTYYLGASSSQLQAVSKSPVLDKITLGVAGESVKYEGDRLDEIKERFRARLLFTEEAGGVMNYYLYSPVLGEGVFLMGYRVNLHIAVSSNGTCAGTPLIFGGY